MKKIHLLIILFIAFLGNIQAQSGTVRIFLHQWVTPSYNAPHQPWVQTAYASFFSTVNITTGSVPATMGSLDIYDAVWITEMNWGGVNNVMSNTQQAVVQDYVARGGHVVWVSEQGCCGGSNHPLTTISNVFGKTLTRAFSGANPVVPYHGTAGPAGLTAGVPSMPTTSSYEFFTGPANLIDNVVFTVGAGVNSCNLNTIQGMSFFFPGPYLCDANTGTLLLTGEVQQFASWGTGAPQQAVHMRNIASLHKLLISNNIAGITALNNSFVPNSHCAAAIPCILLPIELGDFVVNKDGFNTAVLNWTTHSELNSKGFEIEHALPTNALPEFNLAGYVEAVGNSSITQFYQHKVFNLIPGTHYFRLKMLDLDGSYSYSDIKTLEVDEKSSNSRIFPTLLSDISTELTIVSGVDDEVQVEIISMLGQQTYSLYKGAVFATQTQRIAIDPAAYPAGHYLLRVRGKQLHLVEKLTLIR